MFDLAKGITFADITSVNTVITDVAGSALPIGEHTARPTGHGVLDADGGRHLGARQD